MTLHELLRGYNPWWADSGARRESTLPNRRHRPFGELSAAAARADAPSLILRGPRRVGKTVLLRQLADWLIEEESLPAAQLLYADLSDPLLDAHGRGPEVLDAILRAWPNAKADVPRVALLDEIQAVPDWDRWLKNALDWKGLKVIATGSSSLNLAEGGRESGRGRWTERTIESLTFPEYLDLQALPRESRERVLSRKPIALDQYLEHGGLPEHLGSTDSTFALRRRMREDVERDIKTELSGIVRNADITRRLYQIIAVDSGTNYSTKKLTEALGVTKNTVAQHLQCLEDMLLVKRLGPATFSSSGAPRSVRRRLSQDRLFVTEHGHIGAFAGVPHVLREPHAAANLHETVVYRALREVEDDLECREIAYRRDDDTHAVDFVLTLPQGQIGIEVTSSPRIVKKAQTASRAAARFEIPVGIVARTAASDDVNGIPCFGLESFLLDPVAAIRRIQG